MENNDFEFILTDDGTQQLMVHVTPEGVIFDVFIDDELVATWGQTAEEIAVWVTMGWRVDTVGGRG